jgi:hypothetical protein
MHAKTQVDLHAHGRRNTTHSPLPLFPRAQRIITQGCHFHTHQRGTQRSNLYAYLHKIHWCACAYQPHLHGDLPRCREHDRIERWHSCHQSVREVASHHTRPSRLHLMTRNSMLLPTYVKETNNTAPNATFIAKTDRPGRFRSSCTRPGVVK